MKGRQEEKSFAIRGFELDECPVSLITAKSATLVKLWQKAERQKTTLGQLLGMDEAWVEDVEDILHGLQEQITDAYETDREKRLNLNHG